MTISFFTLAKLLWRAQDWERDPESIWEDSVRHKTRAIRFYSGVPVRFRDAETGEIIYEANTLSWILISVILAPRVRRAVFGGKKQ